MNDYPKCLQKVKDCKFNKDGKCLILNDTHFNKPCPFKKFREVGK